MKNKTKKKNFKSYTANKPLNKNKNSICTPPPPPGKKQQQKAKKTEENNKKNR